MVGADDDPEIPTGSVFSGAKDAALSIASSLFGDLPFSGEVNLLTTGAFSPGGTLSSETLPRGIAYLAIGATPSTIRLVDPATGNEYLTLETAPSRSHLYVHGLTSRAEMLIGGAPRQMLSFWDLSVLRARLKELNVDWAP